MSAAAPEGAPSCGDFGGEKRDGSDCTRQAGWGTDHLGEGRCKDHTSAKAEKVRRVKEDFLGFLEEQPMTLQKAARNAGVSPATIHRYREADPGFDRRVKEAKVQMVAQRLELHEDSLTKRVLEGKAAASLEMFWAVNMALRLQRARGGPLLWQHLYNLEVDVTSEGEALFPLSALQQARQELEQAEQGSIPSPWAGRGEGPAPALPGEAGNGAGPPGQEEEG